MRTIMAYRLTRHMPSKSSDAGHVPRRRDKNAYAFIHTHTHTQPYLFIIFCLRTIGERRVAARVGKWSRHRRGECDVLLCGN